MVALPEVAVDASVSDFIAQVTTTAINAGDKLVAFQGDFTFDERVVTFQNEPVQNAGLTGGNWNVSGNVLDGTGPMRTLRISAYSNDLTALSGSGTLFELRMSRVSKAAQGTQLIWAPSPDNFIFIDADLKTQKPGYPASGGVTSSGKAPVKPAPAPPEATTEPPMAPADEIDQNRVDGNTELRTPNAFASKVLSRAGSLREQVEAPFTGGNSELLVLWRASDIGDVLFSLRQRPMPLEPWQRIRLE
jgi:hypothetical protein